MSEENIKNNGGVDCNMNNDSEILAINSPHQNSGNEHCVGGPYAVIYKNVLDRWAIVALDFDDTATLGIRHFRGEKGGPISRGIPIWSILPEDSQDIILNTLVTNEQDKEILQDFLGSEESKLTGDDLQVIWQIKDCFTRALSDQTLYLLHYDYYKNLKKYAAQEREKKNRNVKELLKKAMAAYNSGDKAACNEIVEAIRNA